MVLVHMQYFFNNNECWDNLLRLNKVSLRSQWKNQLIAHSYYKRILKISHQPLMPSTLKWHIIIQIQIHKAHPISSLIKKIVQFLKLCNHVLIYLFISYSMVRLFIRLLQYYQDIYQRNYNMLSWKLGQCSLFRIQWRRKYHLKT